MPISRKPKNRRVSSAKAKGKDGPPSSLISVTALVCEKILIEPDGVMSAIRIADLFFITRHPDIPIEKQAVAMRVYVACKFKPQDPSEHTIRLELIRPDGELVAIGEQKGKVVSDKFPEAPGGFNLVAEVGLVPKQMGTHYVVALVDGKEKARIPITLLERKPASAG